MWRQEVIEARMPIFYHDGLQFHFRETGSGIPFVFQHGLGADVNQPFGLFRPPLGFRLIAFDCRAHGQTVPLGDDNKISIAAFADDLAALLEYLSITSAIVGGISMGAAVALDFALRFRNRVLGLVLSRPAWLDRPLPADQNPFAKIAELIRQHGAIRGAVLFKETKEYQRCLHESPDAATSLLGQFSHPRAEETVVKLERLPLHIPAHGREEWASITVPTLVLANRQDPIHPYVFGETLARMIPGAEFRELTPKSVSVEAHGADVQRYIEAFLESRFWEVHFKSPAAS
jgi:pimeloyl-ACP methyl ester carboxylesterase